MAMPTDARPEPTSAARRLGLAGVALATGLLPVTTFFATRSVPAVVAVSATLLAAAAFLGSDTGRWRAEAGATVRSGPFLVGVALVLWSLVTPLLDSPYALDVEAVARLAGSLGIVALWHALASLAPPPDPGRLLRLSLVGLGLGGALILFERLSGLSLRGFLGLEPYSHMTNRTAIVLAVVSAVFLARFGPAHRAAAFLVSLWALAVVILMKESQTAQLIVVGFAVALVPALFLPRLTLYGGATLTAVVLLFGPLILTHLALPESGWLKPLLVEASAAHRLEIWHTYVPYIFERPITGYGIGTEHLLVTGPDPKSGRIIALQWHPHSLLVQAWLNLGLVGVLILIAGIATLAAAIDRLAAWPRAVATALFAAVFAAASISHGAWQEWWVVLVGLAFVAIGRAGAGQAAGRAP